MNAQESTESNVSVDIPEALDSQKEILSRPDTPILVGNDPSIRTLYADSEL